MGIDYYEGHIYGFTLKKGHYSPVTLGQLYEFMKNIKNIYIDETEYIGRMLFIIREDVAEWRKSGYYSDYPLPDKGSGGNEDTTRGFPRGDRSPDIPVLTEKEQTEYELIVDLIGKDNLTEPKWYKVSGVSY